jgi:hypothetical protein
LMLWMCCLSFAQEEKNELGLLPGSEVIPQAATSYNRKLSFGRSIAYSVDYAPSIQRKHCFAPGVPVRCRAES